MPGRESSFGEKFLNWSLTFGRYIIIGTEIIVLVAFFSRFKLDRDFIDLHDQVKEKQKILAALKPVEERVNSLQIRLSEIKKIEEAAGSGIRALPDIAPLTPPEITYKSITISQDKITILGEAAGTSDISRFTSSLSSAALFKKESVLLEKIERIGLEESGITFVITAVVEKKEEQ